MADAPLPAYESHSSISTYRACPLRYGFRYVERRPGEVSPGQFAFGNAVHRAFEAFGLARIRARVEGTPEPGPEVLQAALDAKLASSGLAPDEIEEARRRAVPVLARFLAREAATTAEPIAVELGFGVDVALPAEGSPGAADPPTEAAASSAPMPADRVRFVGYVDRVDRAADGSTEIVDYKTGRPRDQADVDADPQLTAYAFGCARGGLRDPATGEILPPASRLGLYFAETGETAWTTRSAEQLAAFEAGLVETVGRIRARAVRRPAGSLALPLVRVPPRVPERRARRGRLTAGARAHRPDRRPRAGRCETLDDILDTVEDLLDPTTPEGDRVHRGVGLPRRRRGRRRRRPLHLLVRLPAARALGRGRVPPLPGRPPPRRRVAGHRPPDRDCTAAPRTHPGPGRPPGLGDRVDRGPVLGRWGPPERE